MTLRVSLRHRELLGARPPAMPCAPQTCQNRRLWRVAGSQFGTKCLAQESSRMMLRVSLRSRELLGARPPIFPWAPVPGSERRASEWRGYGMGNGREKRRKVSMD